VIVDIVDCQYSGLWYNLCLPPELAADFWEKAVFGESDEMNLVQSLERQMAKPNANVPELQAGDIVKVHVRIVEGDRERIQVFQGTIIRLRKGGVNANFTVRRVASHGIGVERTFLLYSPRIDKVEVVRHSKVRRAQLYFLRGRRGRAARLKELR
jgi:large subunit ribosomal protein L19